MGDEIYDRDVRPQAEPEHNGEFVAIDLDTGEWEMDADDMVASKRLCERRPDAQIWLARVGSRYLFKFGAAMS